MKKTDGVFMQAASNLLILHAYYTVTKNCASMHSFKTLTDVG